MILYIKILIINTFMFFYIPWIKHNNMHNFVALTIDFSNNLINRHTLLAIEINKVTHNKACITGYYEINKPHELLK